MIKLLLSSLKTDKEVENLFLSKLDDLIRSFLVLPPRNNNNSTFGEENNQNNFRRKITKGLGRFALVLLAIFFITNMIYTVNESEQAIVTTFGKVTAVQDAGLHFKVPYPIQSVRKVEVNRTQKMQIGYFSDNEKEAIDQPYNITESKMITGDFNIVNIDFFIEWKISDPVKFMYNSNNPTSILRNIAQASARSIIGSKSVDGVLTTEKNVIQSEIKEKIMTKMVDYDLGIQIIDVKIQDSEPPTDMVREAFKGVETAKQQRETYINEAMAYQNATIPAAESNADKQVRGAEGYKESRINEAIGDVARFNAMFEEYDKNKEITKTRMYLETIEKVFPNIPVYIESSSDGIQKMLPLKDFVETEKGGN